MSKLNIESHDVVVRQFVLKENGREVPAGELLGALMILTESKKNGNELDVSPEVIDYLKENQYIEESEPSKYKLRDGQKDRSKALGNKVSKLVDNEISKLPIGTEIKLPQILVVSPEEAVEPKA